MASKDRRASSAAMARHSAKPFLFHVSDPHCQELLVAVGSYRDNPGTAPLLVGMSKSVLEVGFKDKQFVQRLIDLCM